MVSVISSFLPAKSFRSTKLMTPKAKPVAILKVNGIMKIVKKQGRPVVISEKLILEAVP